MMCGREIDPRRWIEGKPRRTHFPAAVAEFGKIPPPVRPLRSREAPLPENDFPTLPLHTFFNPRSVQFRQCTVLDGWSTHPKERGYSKHKRLNRHRNCRGSSAADSQSDRGSLSDGGDSVDRLSRVSSRPSTQHTAQRGGHHGSRPNTQQRPPTQQSALGSTTGSVRFTEHALVIPPAATYECVRPYFPRPPLTARLPVRNLNAILLYEHDHQHSGRSPLVGADPLSENPPANVIGVDQVGPIREAEGQVVDCYSAPHGLRAACNVFPSLEHRRKQFSAAKDRIAVDANFNLVVAIATPTTAAMNMKLAAGSEDSHHVAGHKRLRVKINKHAVTVKESPLSSTAGDNPLLLLRGD